MAKSGTLQRISSALRAAWLSTEAGAEAAITVFDIPLASFPPGNYTLRIQVTDHVKNEAITKDLDLVLK